MNVTTQVTRVSLPNLLKNWAAANGRTFATRYVPEQGGRLVYEIDGHRLDSTALGAIYDTRRVDDDVVYAAITRIRRAEAETAHAEYPQYADHWDGWDLVEITEKVRVAGGVVAFEVGDLVLHCPQPAGAWLAELPPHFDTCYSFRTGRNTSVPTHSVMPAGACRRCRGYEFELRINPADPSGPMQNVACPDCLAPAAAALAARS